MKKSVCGHHVVDRGLKRKCLWASFGDRSQASQWHTLEWRWMAVLHLEANTICFIILLMYLSSITFKRNAIVWMAIQYETFFESTILFVQSLSFNCNNLCKWWNDSALHVNNNWKYVLKNMLESKNFTGGKPNNWRIEIYRSAKVSWSFYICVRLPIAGLLTLVENTDDRLFKNFHVKLFE